MSFARRLKSIHLRLVLQVALTGKLQAAAEEIALSQPAASRMLAEIEKLVGAALFTRHAKGMVPTPIGEVRRRLHPIAARPRFRRCSEPRGACLRP